MSLKERIVAEIDRVEPERLEELYCLVLRFAGSPKTSNGQRLLAKLRGVRLEGPQDFAANLDLYLSGEKSVGEDVR